MFPIMVFLEPGENIDLVSFSMPSIMGTQEHAQFFAYVQPDIVLFVESQLFPVQSSFWENAMEDHYLPKRFWKPPPYPASLFWGLAWG